MSDAVQLLGGQPQPLTGALQAQISDLKAKALVYQTSSVTMPGTRKPGQAVKVSAIFGELVSGLCKADSATTAFCTGIIIQGNEGTPVIVQFGDIVELTVDEWDAVIDGGSSTGLTIGAPYFVSDATEGNITTTPTGTSKHFVTLIGWALSATEMLFQVLLPPQNP